MGQRDSRLERLAREHGAAVANYLRRRIYPLSPSELDDLVEEVLVITWRRLDAVPVDAEAAWMIGTARNVLANARRKQSRRDTFMATMRPSGTDASAEEYVVADAAIRDALASLSDADREILLLHYWDGLDAAQLATVFSVTTNAAAVRLSRSLGRFRELMGADQVA